MTVKGVPFFIGNGDLGEVGDPITVTASDGDCPAGTVGIVDLSRVTGVQNPVTVAGGQRVGGYMVITVRAANVTTPNRLSPQRCTALVTATGPTSPDPEPSSNTTRVVIDVIDGNDF